MSGANGNIDEIHCIIFSLGERKDLGMFSTVGVIMEMFYNVSSLFILGEANRQEDNYH